MLQTVLFALQESYADWECAYLASALQALGRGKFCAKTVSLLDQKLHSLGGFAVLPDYNEARHTGNELNAMKRWAGDAYTGEAHFVRRQAVWDGDLVTANGSAALAFAREVLLALSVAPAEDISQWYAFCKAALTPVEAP